MSFKVLSKDKVVGSSHKDLFQIGYEFPLKEIGLDLPRPTISSFQKIYLPNGCPTVGHTRTSVYPFDHRINCEVSLQLPESCSQELEAGYIIHEGSETAYQVAIMVRTLDQTRFSRTAGEYVGNFAAYRFLGLLLPVVDSATDLRQVQKDLKRTLGKDLAEKMFPQYEDQIRCYADANEFIMKHKKEDMKQFLEFLFLENYPIDIGLHRLYEFFKGR